MQLPPNIHVSANDSAPAGPLIGCPQCMRLTDLGRTAWLDRVRRKEAPQPIKIGRRTMWVEAEVLAYVAECVRRYREGAGA